MRNFLNSEKILAIIPISLLTITALSFVPVAHAYGQSNYQVAFSGNCNNKSICGVTLPTSPPTYIPGTFGFWGWCEFGGGTGSAPTSGTDADCEGPFYSFLVGGAANHFGPIQGSVRGTAWTIASGFTGFPDFFITDGAVTYSGPIVGQVLAIPGFASLLLFLGCTISGSTFTCSIPVLEALGIYNPDTGIVAFPGHFGTTSCTLFVGPAGDGLPGCHYDQTVTVIP